MNTQASRETPPKLPRLVNTLMVIALGITLAAVSLQFLPQGTAAPAEQSQGTTNAISGNAGSAPAPTDLARIIADVHLFGDASKVAIVQEEPEPQEPIEDTKLNLQLAGVFAFDPQENAIAIISVGSAEQSAYGVGDKISGGASLEAVYPDHVIIRNDGKLEKLALPENVQPIALAPVQSAQPDNSQQNAQANDGQALELPTNPGQLRDTLARNPAMLGRVVAAEPYQENGKLLGYRITPKQNPEILEAQGIVAGDIITSVNNIQLNSQKQGIRALRNAVKAESLEVVVLRDGIEIPISISLAQ